MYQLLIKHSDHETCRWQHKIWTTDNSASDNKALQTKVKLASRGFNHNINCCFCQMQPETIHHLYFECAVTNKLWNHIMVRCGITW